MWRSSIFLENLKKFIDQGKIKYIGLSNDWAVRIIKAVGNYQESYERNVGPNTPLQLDRGVNALWSQGGVQYAPPVR